MKTARSRWTTRFSAYINEREQLIKDMDELTEQMTQLQAAQQSLNTVTATSAG